MPGRFEIINKDENKKIPKLILDGAHTKDSLKFTFDTFKSLYNSQANLLFACASDKNMDEMSKLFFEYKVKSLILTKPGFEKGSNLPYLAECTKKLNEENNNLIDLQIIENPKDAILKSFELAYQNDEPVLICGSFYLLAEVKSLLQTL